MRISLLLLPSIVAGQELSAERIWFEVWSVGEHCGSDDISGCREAATTYLTDSASAGYQTADILAFMTIGLSDGTGEPVDLTKQNLLIGKNFTQVNNVCRMTKPASSESISLTLYPGYTTVQSGGGCLSEPGTEARAFLAALVQPPSPDGGVIGGEVEGCPEGICIVGLHAPQGAIKTSPATIVGQVCGAAAVRGCIVGVGDFNSVAGAREPSQRPPPAALDDRWTQLFGREGGAVVSTHGVHSATIASNIPRTGPSMDINQGFPLSKQFGNITGQGQASLVDLLLPCAHPDPHGEYCGK